MPQDNLSQIEGKMDFLQSEEWRKFQESAGNKTFHIEQDGFWANIVEHKLPVVGNYFYIPKGLIFNQLSNDKISQFLNDLINLTKKEKVGWVRIDIENEEGLNVIKNNISCKITKAPHDMQPKEVFVIDITKSEEQLLGEMKSKTRYNIKLAEKKNVKIINNQSSVIEKKHLEEFIKLISLTAKRKGIKFHPGDYYRKMVEAIYSDILSLYVAEYNGKVIAANLVVFYGKTATYLHGATDDEYRNVMAPYLLQWQAIKDAKEKGCKFYDFGGIKSVQSEKLKVKSDWNGITKFKLGFSPETKPKEFLGSYDIILNPQKFFLYRILQKIKNI